MSAAARLLGLAALPAAAAVVVACDPCNGVLGCTVAARVGVSGQIVDRQSGGAPVSGVRVEVVRTGGVETDAPSATTTTDGQGTWEVSLGAHSAGVVDVDVVVTPAAPGMPYRVRGLQLNATTTRGQGNVVGRWAAQPYISYIGTLRDRVTGQPIAGATVTYSRAGGIEVDTTIATLRTQQTSGLGYFFLDLRPRDFAPLYANFVVTRPGYDTLRIHNVAIMPGYEWGPPIATAGAEFRVGLGLEYFVRVVNRATGQTSPGWLTFQRTGGVMVDPTRKAFPSGIGDTLNFSFRPSAAGVLTGDAFFEPAGTRDTVYFRNLQFATFDTVQAPTVTLYYGNAPNASAGPR